MGKLARNKIAPKKAYNPKKDFKPKKDNWVKGKNQKSGRYKDTAQTVHKSKKDSPGNPPQQEEPIKVKPVRDDPFFISGSPKKLPKPENDSHSEPKINKFTLRGNPDNKNAEGHDDNRRKSLSRRSKYFTLRKSKDESSDFVSSPVTAGKFFVKTNEGESPESAEENPKKAFDKKKWRMQKYSHRYKLDQWEEKRKKAILRGYFKDMKGTDKKFDVQKIYAEHQSSEDEDAEPKDPTIDTENENNLNASIHKGRTLSNQSVEMAEELPQDETKEVDNSRNKKNKAYQKAQLEYDRIKNEKKQRKEDLAKKKKERDEALKIYKQKKVEKFKRLSRRTKKGQPIMKDHIENLLEKIQKNLGRNK